MMKNKKIIFWNLDKKELPKELNLNAKYIIISNHDEIDLNRFIIKPIVITHHGALVKDLENNFLISSNTLNEKDIVSFIDYAKTHNVKLEEIVVNNNLYELKITSLNYYRMLIIPSLVSSEHRTLNTIYNYPFSIDNKNYVNFLVSKHVSLIDNIISILDYLKLESNDILTLTNISFELLDLINKNGFCITNQNLKLNYVRNKLESECFE